MNPELWTRHPVIATLSLVPLVAGTLWMWLAPRLPWAADPAGRRALEWGTWIATRLAFAFVLWVLLDHRSVDTIGFFVPQARRALAGLVPYRDFATAYAPLFPTLLALPVKLWGELGPGLVFLAADFLAWRILSRRDGGRSGLTGAAWYYVAFPPVWYFTVRYAQDETLGALFLAAALVAAERRRPATAGLCLAGGLLLTKPLFALAALPFFAVRGLGRGRLLAACALPVAAVYGACLAAGAPVWQPLVLEGHKFGVGPTLWRVLRLLGSPDLPAWSWLPWALAWGGGTAWLARRGAGLVEQLVWSYAVFAFLSLKFMPMYVVVWAPALAAWVAQRRAERLAWFALTGLLLGLAWYLESGPVQGMFGPAARAVAVAGLLGGALCGLWLALAVLAPRSDPRAAA